MSQKQQQTRQELIVEICRTVGTLPSPNQDTITKRDLNSIHAYLTGDFVERPDRLYASGSKSRVNVLKHVLKEAETDVTPADLSGRSKPYTLNRNELAALLETLENNPDGREWTP